MKKKHRTTSKLDIVDNKPPHPYQDLKQKVLDALVNQLPDAELVATDWRTVDFATVKGGGFSFPAPEDVGYFLQKFLTGAPELKTAKTVAVKNIGLGPQGCSVELFFGEAA